MFTLVRRAALASTVLLSVAILPSRSEAQGVLDELSDSSIVLMARQGMTVKQFRTGALSADENTTLTLTMPAGKTGSVMAVCDQDCSDIDLVVRSGGQEIGSDLLADDAPVVMIENRSGPMSVEVRMVSCSVAPCAYRVILFVN